jgi:lipopolysaccharide transport system permease protein
VSLTTEKPELVVTGGRGRLTAACAAELWAFREVLSAFAIRQIKVRYKQATVGIGWAVIQPVLSAAVFAVFLGRVAKLPSEGSSYLVFALAGMVLWGYFSAAAAGAMESLVTDQAILRKIYFPREVLPLASVAAALVDLAAAAFTFLVVATIGRHAPGIQWLALPVPVVLVVLAATSVGVLFAALNVYYRDMRFLLPFILQLGMFVSPVVYSVQQVPSRWRTLYTAANPVAAAIDSLRRIVLHHQWPDVTVVSVAFVWAVVALALSYSLFKRLERSFADRV